MATASVSSSDASRIEIPLSDDLEKGRPPKQDSGHAGGLRAISDRHLKEAAGLLFVFSLFALVEGTARMTVNSNPEPDFDFTSSMGGTRIPGAVLLAGGVAEVIFGLGGIFVALYSLVFEVNSRAMTLAFAVLQSVLGWFVFLTFVVAGPILRAINDEMFPALLSRGEFRALVILGEMFGGITFCYALQGGQFIMALNLAAAQKGTEWSRAKSATRAMIWSINALVASFSTTFVGSLLAARDFVSPPPFPVPPHVVWFPALSIVTGLVMLVYGATCLVASKVQAFGRAVGVLFPLVTVMMLVNFSWVFGKVPEIGLPLVGALQHIGLVFSVTILPAYHAIRTHKDP